jgi:formylglycine-generating enzyme required for sulfatase activity
LQKEIANSIGMEFILISAGSFTMGSNTICEYERPRHKVEISQPFYLQTTEVTQGQWKRVMGNNPSHFKNCGDDCPVERVSWEDVQNFIIKLRQIEKTTKYCLPSEAEWEYACRAGGDDEFSFGDDTARLKEFGWYGDNSEDKTQPVRKKKPNPWGLYDMHGNVWEWVEDDWHENYEGAPTDGRAWIDNPRGTCRVIRGGSWFYDAPNCRSAVRLGWPDARDFYVGFRLSRAVAALSP